MSGISNFDPWVIPPEAKAKYDAQFLQLQPLGGVITGDQAKRLFLQSGLPAQVLAKVWALADMDADGKINRYEFAVALHLIQLRLKGFDLPAVLPPSLQSPSSSVPHPNTGIYGAGFGNMSTLVSLPSAIPSSAQPHVTPVAVPTAVSAAFSNVPAPIPPPTVPMTASIAPGVGKQPSSTATVASTVPMAAVRPFASGATSPPQLTEWAVPQQSKLKYTQLFNSQDRSRSGFLTGAQARTILLQSGLPSLILAQIWNLADIDNDGQLTSEEFVLAMHLADCVKAGDSLPVALPLELVPPSYRRKRSDSVQSGGSGLDLGGLVGETREEDKKLLALTTFEDKRKENFEKGQAELERRRQALLESQRKEQEERERKEREEQEKRERIRQEQERRRQLELEKQLTRQREIELEKEEQRRKALEQREAARREMERQRQLEWERQRMQELISQRQREQEAVSHLKGRKKTYLLQLEQVNNKLNEINSKIADTKKGVADLKSCIDEMKSDRDAKLSELNSVKQEVKDLNDKMLLLNQEKLMLNGQLKAAVIGSTSDPYSLTLNSYENKEITLNTLRTTLKNIDKELAEKKTDVENNNSEISVLQKKLDSLMTQQGALTDEYKEKKQEILSQRNLSDSPWKDSEKRSVGSSDTWPESAWSDGFGGSGTDAWADTTWSDKDNFSTTTESDMWPSQDGSKILVKYRALYAFEARNNDEISFMPGDIILVQENSDAEPGWLSGELQGRSGWFPESYVERMVTPTESQALDQIDTGPSGETVHIVGTEIKRTLEGISEAPENGADNVDGTIPGVLQPSENSSFTQLPKGAATGTSSPVPGQGEMAPQGLQAQALFPWRAKKENHLSFNKGDVIAVKEQQDMWWYGECQNKLGWFPKSYVKLISGPVKSIQSDQSDSMDLPFEELPPVPDEGGIGEQYEAMYAYQSQEPGDLSFVAGDIITVLKKEGDWWTGMLNGDTGIFPNNYVKPIELKPQETTAPQPQIENASPIPVAAGENNVQSSEHPKLTKKPEIATVIAAYKATGPEQLNLEKGQLIQVRKKTECGWWEGELQVKGKKRQTGWFPASYVKVLGGGSGSSRNSPVPTIFGAGAQGEQVCAIFGFTAQHEDELTFQKGQIITVLGKDDASWWKGEIDGVVGLFPSNYVQPVEKASGTDKWPGIDSTVLSNLSNREKKRQGHIHELMSTEENYCRDLNLVLEVFYKPMKDSGILSKEELHTIFVNWNELLICSTKLLKSFRVRTHMSSDGVIEMIGDILCENLQHLNPYIRFCSCQVRSMALIQQKSVSDPKFKQFTRDICKNPQTKGMPFTSYLLKPVQRMTKYPLMIKKIQEHTDPDHNDYSHLEEALKKAEQLCNQINEAVKEQENSDRLEWAQSHIQCNGLSEQLVFNSCTNLLGPRKFLHSGSLSKVKSGKELMGFLFSDFLLLAQPLRDVAKVTNVFVSEQAMNSQYRMYKQPIFLHNAMIKELSDGASEDSFVIHTPDLICSLRAVNANEKLLWVKKLVTAARHYRNTMSKPKEASVRQKAAVGKLRIIVVQANALQCKNGKGQSDPYCEVSMASEEHRTPVAQNTVNPQWNTSMQFLVKDIKQDVLCISVFNRELFSPNDFLGRTEIRIIDIYQETREIMGPIVKHLKLYEVESGEVVIKLDLQIFDT